MSDPNSTQDCTAISADCPVDATIYGYYPNLGANAFFCAFFGIFVAANLFLGFRHKTWVFALILAVGCSTEALGYVGRILMHDNPWSSTGFQIQICTLVIAPSFFAAAIYITLKHIVRAVGPQYSPIKAALYPWIFVTCDLISLVAQGVGGGVAASANSESGSDLGGHIMLAGIVFQVATFTFLYILAAIFITNLSRNRNTLTAENSQILLSRDFKIFIIGVFIASFAVYVRCIYRIAELAGGWANTIMRDEISFMILDPAMCAIAVAALTIFYPAIFFKPMVTPLSTQEKNVTESSSESVV